MEGSKRFLFIQDCSGVCTLLAYHLQRLGHEVKVMVADDVFGIYSYYKRKGVNVVFTKKGKRIIFNAIREARKYDVVHVSSLDYLASILKTIYPKKTIILHYHGSDFRGKEYEKWKYCLLPDFVLVSTPDMLDPELGYYLAYLPAPVDTELFKNYNSEREDVAVYFRLNYEDEKRAIDRAKGVINVPVRVLERKFKYHELPILFNKIKYFIDRYSIKSLSKTALEALACGCKVVNYKGEVVEKLPNYHKPEFVVESYLRLIEES